MARLLGFTKTKGTAEGQEKLLRLYESKFLAQTETGEFNNIGEIDSYISFLETLGQTTEVQTKIADMQGKKLKFEQKRSDLLNERGIFDVVLKESLTFDIQDGFENPIDMIGSMAASYQLASNQFDDDVYGKIANQYGTVGAIPQDVLDYQRELGDREKFFTDLFHSYQQQDEEGLFGNFDPNAFEVLVDVNQANGKVIGIDIVPSGSVDRNTWMRTDTPLRVLKDRDGQRLPTSIMRVDAGRDDDGKQIWSGVVGGIEYQGLEEDGILKARDTNVGVLGASFFGLLGSDNQAAKDAVEFGMDFSEDNYVFDKGSIPNNRLLRMGDRLFYATEEGSFLEMAGNDYKERKQMSESYLKKIGQNPNQNISFIDRFLLADESGASRVTDIVDENYFKPSSLGGDNTLTPQGGKSYYSFPISKEEEPRSSFFSDAARTKEGEPRVNRPSPPKESTESSGGALSVPDIIEKGKSFFRNLNPKDTI